MRSNYLDTSELVGMLKIIKLLSFSCSQGEEVDLAIVGEVAVRIVSGEDPVRREAGDTAQDVEAVRAVDRLNDVPGNDRRLSTNWPGSCEKKQ